MAILFSLQCSIIGTGGLTNSGPMASHCHQSSQNRISQVASNREKESHSYHSSVANMLSHMLVSMIFSLSIIEAVSYYGKNVGINSMTLEQKVVGIHLH